MFERARRPARVLKARSLAATIAALVVATGVAGCGGSGEVVATVGESQVTKAAVNHWMATLAGGDYYELSHGHVLPSGLVSDPPNYAQCVSRLRAAAAANPVGGGVSPSVLLKKCRELNLALRLQAASWLVDSEQLTALDRAEGITASEGQVQQLFKHIQATEYPTQEQLREYLRERHSSLADLLYVVRLDVLRQETSNRLAAGGSQTRAQFEAASRKWIAKTNCNAGYVVQDCKQFTGGAKLYGGLSPAVLMEQVTALVTGLCVNKAACGGEQ